MKHEMGYMKRIENISYKSAEKRVLDRLGFVKTKPGVGFAWYRPTKSTYFLGERGGIRAIYSHTMKQFWWIS